MHTQVAVDFGTTNSAIAVYDDQAGIQVARFATNSHFSETFRSVLYFEQVRKATRRDISAYAGPEAISRYLAADSKGRLIQSLKSYLASRSLRATNIFGRAYLLEDLISYLLRSLRNGSQASLGLLGHQAVVGRPVRFAGADTPADDDFAVTRLRSALLNAGFENVRFELEPVGAAYFYESRLDHDECVLVADFGGGTSDFSLIRVGPSFQRRHLQRQILGNEGVALAGDAFDAKIVRNVIAPLLGKGTLYKSMDKYLELPAWIYAKLERWHHLSFLKSPETMNELRSLRSQALEPEFIEALIHVVNDDLGFYLHQAVQRTKFALSEQEASVFSFRASGIDISKLVTRTEFETWIADELHSIEGAVDRLLHHVGIEANDIDRVFLTGGSSFVPAVRRIFQQRFGNDKLSGGGEFTSVADGLARMSSDDQGSTTCTH